MKTNFRVDEVGDGIGVGAWRAGDRWLSDWAPKLQQARAEGEKIVSELFGNRSIADVTYSISILTIAMTHGYKADLRYVGGGKVLVEVYL